MAEEIMDIEEAAAYLGISKMWLYKACREGHIPHVRFGNKYRFHKATLDEWMRESSRSKRQIKVAPPVRIESPGGRRGRRPRAAEEEPEG
ncbi:MAG: helix-turn-helix domain-containing protein [Candidatus Bathyarchaeia archaeon]